MLCVDDGVFVWGDGVLCVVGWCVVCYVMVCCVWDEVCCVWGDVC